MIKNTIKKLFFADAPAQGTVFALALWLIWLYITFPFWLWLLAAGDGCEPGHTGKIAAGAILWIAWGLTVYLAAMMLILCYRSCRESKWRRYVFWAILGCDVSLLAESVSCGDLLRPVMLTLIFGCWILPVLLIGKIRWYTYCLNALLWTGAAVILAAVHHKFWAETEMWFMIKRPFYGTDFYRQTAKFFGISGDDWVWFTLLGVLLLAGGVLLAAKIASDAAAVKLRQMFSRQIMILGAAAVLIYLVFLIMALTAGQQLRQSGERLAQRFGRPVNAPALGLLYYGKDRPDRGYWQTVVSLSDKCQADDRGSIDYDLDPATAPPFFWDRFAEIKDDLARWEQAFSGPIPPDERDFRPGKLLYYEHGNSYFFRRFEYLEVWQIYLALSNHDPQGALAVYWRLKHVNDFLLRDARSGSGSLWVSCENIRLDALQLLLESNELTMDDLQTLAADLRTVEQQLPANFERALYTQIVNERDEYISFGQGGPLYMAKIITLPLKKLRFFYPPVWWQVNQRIQRQLTDFGSVEYTSDCFLLLRLRAAQTIIRAIEYQRQHGRYPQTLDDLPANPYTGKPLQYRVGDCEVEIRTAVKDQNGWAYQSNVQTVPAVRCWGNEPDYRRQINFTVRIKP